MSDALATCTLCNQSFPQYMAACPHCGTYQAARTNEQVVAEAGPTRISALAVTGFVLSLTIWLMPILGSLIALGVSYFGLRQTRDPLSGRTGQGFAIAGIVISGLSLLCWIFLFTLPLWAGESYTDKDGVTHWSVGDEQ